MIPLPRNSLPVRGSRHVARRRAVTIDPVDNRRPVRAAQTGRFRAVADQGSLEPGQRTGGRPPADAVSIALVRAHRPARVRQVLHGLEQLLQRARQTTRVSPSRASSRDHCAWTPGPTRVSPLRVEGGDASRVVSLCACRRLRNDALATSASSASCCRAVDWSCVEVRAMALTSPKRVRTVGFGRRGFSKVLCALRWCGAVGPAGRQGLPPASGTGIMPACTPCLVEPVECGASGGTRTPTSGWKADFESAASTSSATEAHRKRINVGVGAAGQEELSMPTRLPEYRGLEEA